MIFNQMKMPDIPEPYCVGAQAGLGNLAGEIMPGHLAIRLFTFIIRPIAAYRLMAAYRQEIVFGLGRYMLAEVK